MNIHEIQTRVDTVDTATTWQTPDKTSPTKNRKGPVRDHLPKRDKR